MTALTATPALEEIESLCKALGDRTRLRILALLGGDEVCVCNLHDTLGLPQPTVSRHLAYLRRAGLVDARREGVWMHYRISAALSPVRQTILNAAIHALSHVTASARDRHRYQKSFGTLRTLAVDNAVFCCCAPSGGEER